MASRPRRGKQMPMPPPEPEDSDTTSESESSASSLKSTSGPQGEVEETAFVHGELLAEGEERAEEEDDDDDDEGEEEEDGGDNNDGEEDDDDRFPLEPDDFEDDLRPPPTPRVERRRDIDDMPFNLKHPQDFGKIYNELIDTCHSLEGDSGLDENFQHVMAKNIKIGEQVFKHLMKDTESLSKNDSQSSTRRPGGPGDLYLAFLHTQITSTIVRDRAERIGTGASIFSLEVFLNSFKAEYLNEDGEYSPTLAAGNIAKDAGRSAKTLMPLVAVVGTFDRDAVIVPKVKKPRVITRRTNAEEQQDNGAANDESNDTLSVVEKNPTENVAKMAKEMIKILKAYHKQSLEPVNMLEFILDRNSFPRTIENIFNLSFLVKDGHVSIKKEENGKFKDLSLNIKPEMSPGLETNAPDEEESTRNQTVRHKYILSFSPRMWKSLCGMSQGEDILTFYQKMIQNPQLQQPKAIEFN